LPPEAETLLAFERSMEAANSPIFLKFEITDICVVLAKDRVYQAAKRRH